ncbi:hypothetical protein C8J57DRAFT_1726008 [Mycena rebaudengoi]|nr:hypothetical protein C8J57DRAFT_1726008 [Mycena rebaudengoi]
MTSTISAASKMIVAILAPTLAPILDTLSSFSPTNRYMFFFVGSLVTVFHSHFRNAAQTLEPQNYGHNFDVLGNVQLEQMDIEFDLEFDSNRISESDTGPCDTSDMGGYSSQCDPAQYFPAHHKLDRPTLRPPPQFPDPPHSLTSRMLSTMIPQKPVIFSPRKYTRRLPPQAPHRYSRSKKLSACPTKRRGSGADAGAPPCADARFPTKSFPFAVPIATLLLRLRRTIGAPSTQNGESSSHAVSLDPLQDPLQPQRSVSLAKSHSGVANSKAVYSSGLPTTQRPIPLSIPATTIYSDAIPVYPRNNGQGIGKARNVSPPRILASVKWKGRAVEDVPLPQTSTAVRGLGGGASVATTRTSVQSTFSNIPAPPRSMLADPPPVQAAGSLSDLTSPFQRLAPCPRAVFPLHPRMRDRRLRLILSSEISHPRWRIGCSRSCLLFRGTNYTGF